MKTVRYAVSFLLLAATACVQAQPYVRINSANSTTECDVKNPPAGDPIFRLDAQGNVLINGDLSGNGCSGPGGGTDPNATFTPFSTAPAPLAVSPGSIVAGTGTGTISYAAAYATSCSVTSSAGTVAGTGTCPSLTVSNSTCTGAGSPLICAKSSGSATEPTALAAGITSCAYTLTATCNPGSVTSTANLTVTPAQTGGGGGGMPAACQGGGAVTDIGLIWQQSTTMIWLPGQGSTPVSNATDYRNIYSSPTSGAQPWPSGATGVKPTVGIGKNNYLGMAFTVPSTGANGIAADYFNVNSGSQPVAMTISECPGDFGQQGTHITTQYCKCDRTGCGGLVGYVGTAAGTCPLVAGRTYYLNFLDAPLPPANSTTTPTSACLGGSCNAQVELTY